MKRIVPALILCAMLGACVATTPRIEEARLQEVQAGVTTYGDIVKRFGTASLMSKNPDGSSFATYVYSGPEARSTEMVPLVVGEFRDSVTFHFDRSERLTDVKATSRSGAQGTLAVHETNSSQDSNVAAGRPATSAPGAVQIRSDGFLWRIPDWLPAVPRENR